MNDLQKCLLSMLKSFHDFCEHNSLTYVALGGTMLGAVRHNGFIPWDDDIDIGMPRTDYEQLINLLETNDIGKYRLESTQSEDKNYCYPYSKLYDTSTTLIENTKHRLVRGVFLDIFPLDGIGNTMYEAKKKYAVIKRLSNRLVLRKLSIKSDRAWYKNLLIYFIQAVELKSFNEKALAVTIDQICKKKSFTDCSYGGNLLGAWGYKEIMPNNVIGTPKLYKFEDFMIYGPELYDEYLSRLYGDWKKIPPKEKQKSHHDFFLDLNTPYVTYHE